MAYIGLLMGDLARDRTRSPLIRAAPVGQHHHPSALAVARLLCGSTPAHRRRCQARRRRRGAHRVGDAAAVPAAVRGADSAVGLLGAELRRLYPLRWFGLFNLPSITGRNDGLHRTAESMHEWLFWALVVLVAATPLPRCTTSSRRRHPRPHAVTTAGWLRPRQGHPPRVAYPIFPDEHPDRARHAARRCAPRLPPTTCRRPVQRSCSPARGTRAKPSPASSAASPPGSLRSRAGWRRKLDVAIPLATGPPATTTTTTTCAGGDFFASAKFPAGAFTPRPGSALSGNCYAADGTLTLRGATSR